MNSDVETFARLAARKAGRAFSIRATFRIAHDPPESFAVAPIRVVAEELIQAVAFGDPDALPSLVHEALPLSRATAFLEPLSDALEAYLRRAVANGAGRVYVPHATALEMLALLGPRYESNKEASEKVRRLGYLARVLREIAYEPGQQLVVSVADELRAHVVSGGSPTEDAQLRYLLTWLNPPAGGDVAEAAEQNALWPASGMLYHLHDQKIDALRHELKTKRRDPAQVRREIEALQDLNARQEWLSLTDGRDALWRLELGLQRGLSALMESNVATLRWALDTHSGSPKYAIPMARKYADFSYAHTVAQVAALEADDRTFEAAVQTGHAIRGRLERRYTIPKSPQSKKTEVFSVVTEQKVLRLRKGTRLKVRGMPIDGKVLDYVPRPDGSSRIDFAIENGVRSIGSYTAGVGLEFIEGTNKPFWPDRSLLVKVEQQRNVQAILSGSLTRGAGAVDPATDLTQLALQLRGNR